jgi:hypothetical protein
MNKYLDFIKFALDEFTKIDTIDSITISEFGGYTNGIEFEVWFNRKGFKSFKVASWVVSGNFQTGDKISEESMRKCLKEQIKKFINKSNKLKELEKKKNYYEEELNKIKKQITDRNKDE